MTMRTVLTTGANSGIGLATAIEAARRGFRSIGTVRSRLGPWFVVVRRDRPELCEQLTESFGDDPRITEVLDRRRSERTLGRQTARDWSTL